MFKNYCLLFVFSWRIKWKYKEELLVCVVVLFDRDIIKVCFIDISEVKYFVVLLWILDREKVECLCGIEYLNMFKSLRLCFLCFWYVGIGNVIFMYIEYWSDLVSYSLKLF